MSLLLDMVVEKVQSAPTIEFKEFAERLAQALSTSRLRLVEEVLKQEQERRAPDQGAYKRWGI